MHLFSSGSAYDLALESSNAPALAALEATAWGLYRVEHIYERKTGRFGKPFTCLDRRVTCLHQGSQQDVNAMLSHMAERATIEQTYSPTGSTAIAAPRAFIPPSRTSGRPASLW